MIDPSQLHELRSVCVDDGYAVLDAAVAAAERYDWVQVQALASQLRAIAVAADDPEWAAHALELADAPVSSAPAQFPAWYSRIQQLLEIALYRR